MRTGGLRTVANNGKVIVLHSNDIVFLAWQYAKAIPGCLGFSVRRKDLSQASSSFQALPAWVGWQGGTNQNWTAKTTDQWPVQKFNWRDLTAKAGAKYQYEVVPMIGSPNALQEGDQDLVLTSDPVELTPQTANNVSAYFNNGILSTQSVAHLLPPGAGGGPSAASLMTHIKKPGDNLRERLAGQMIDTLKELLLRAKNNNGECYCALYELDDPELISTIIDVKDQVHIILSATPTNDPKSGNGSRKQLHAAGVDVDDRMLDSAHIGHNKFVVYQGPDGAAVLAGSTNWTSTGLCAQSNNSVIIEDATIAGFYLDYWKRLKADTDAAHGVAKNYQGAPFRSANTKSQQSGDTTVWYSPNTKAKTKPKGAEVPQDLSDNAEAPADAPPDMFQVFQLIHDAKNAVLFLEFEPGTPSVLDVIKQVEQNNSNLFIRGAATDPQAIAKFDDKQPVTTELYHRSATGDPDVVNETGVAASAINDEFGYWRKELLKSQGGHAIIHDKIVVIDPMSPTSCVVVMGSHNQGYKASYQNDENLLIFRGNQALALAYTTHVMDVYDHYRWRYMVQQQKEHAWTGLVTTPDWQTRYFEPNNMAYRELEFWMQAPNSAAAAAPAAMSASAGAGAGPVVKRQPGSAVHAAASSGRQRKR